MKSLLRSLTAFFSTPWPVLLHTPFHFISILFLNCIPRRCGPLSLISLHPASFSQSFRLFFAIFLLLSFRRFPVSLFFSLPTPSSTVSHLTVLPILFVFSSHTSLSSSPFSTCLLYSSPYFFFPYIVLFTFFSLLLLFIFPFLNSPVPFSPVSDILLSLSLSNVFHSAGGDVGEMQNAGEGGHGLGRWAGRGGCGGGQRGRGGACGDACHAHLPSGTKLRCHVAINLGR